MIDPAWPGIATATPPNLDHVMGHDRWVSDRVTTVTFAQYEYLRDNGALPLENRREGAPKSCLGGRVAGSKVGEQVIRAWGPLLGHCVNIST